MKPMNIIKGFTLIVLLYILLALAFTLLWAGLTLIF